MALVKATLQTQLSTSIKSLNAQMKTGLSDDEYAEGLATLIADAVDAFVKTANVKIGIAVSTTGTAAAQTGATTAKGIIE